MSFQWQDRDAAARTLGVDVTTLQTWIDDGRAPSRTHQGKVQVLIELLDEPGEPGEPGEPQEQEERKEPQEAQSFSRRATHDADDQRDSAHSHDSEHVHAQAMPTDLELVSKRELQLAGGMVAAWQRVAETSKQDLERARKVGILSWSLVASLLLIGGIGLWFSTRTVTDTQGRLDATQDRLKVAEDSAEKATQKAQTLQNEVALRTQELTEANARLAAAIERANLTKSQADTLAAQHLLTKQLADRQIETAKALADTLQATITQQKERLTALDAELAAARQANDSLTAKVTDGDKRLADLKTKQSDLTAERDDLKKRLETLTSDHASAITLIDDLKKQVGAMKGELDKLKGEKGVTSTAEKNGN